MKQRPLATLLFVLLAAPLPGARGQPAIQPARQVAVSPAPLPHAIIIGWDGVQRDHFWECYNKELPECPDGLPNIQALAEGHIFDLTVTSGATSTKAGWAQILSGYDAEVMGIYSNYEYQPLSEGYTVLEKLEAAYGDEAIDTVFVSGKGVHVGATCQGETDVRGRVEESGQPWCLTKRQIDVFVEAEDPDIPSEASGTRALAAIEDHFRNHADQALVALFHFAQPDSVGHRGGENSVAYSEKIIEVDQWLGSIVAWIRDAGAYDDTLIYVITDHGFDEGGHSHENAPFGFLATNDPLVIRGGDRKDLAATLLERYGIGQGASEQIPPVNGYSLYSLPPIPCVPEGEAYVDYPGAPSCCPGLDLVDLGKLDLAPMAFDPCIPATGGTGDGSGHCTACGDGLCGQNENACTCYEDCAGNYQPLADAQSPAPAAVTCPPGTVKISLLTEAFETWPPPGWTILDHGGDCVVQGNTTWDRPNNTGGLGACADADSDRCGAGTMMDTELRTLPLDLPPASQIRLQYQSSYLNFLGKDQASVEISTDGGAVWTELLTWSEDHIGPVTVDVDLTAYAGSPATLLRWRYRAPGWHWYWEVDDVEVAVCEPAPPSVILTPEWQEGAGCEGDTVEYTMSLWNRTGSAGLFSLSYESMWPALGPTEVYAAQDETVTFPVSVAIEGGDQDTATVTAEGSGYTASALVHTVQRPHWSLTTSMPTPRGDLAVVAADDALYAIGGTIDGIPPGHGDNDRYDLLSDSWSVVAPMPTPLTLVSGAEIDGIVYVPGGYGASGFVSTTQAYDTASNSWTTVAPAPREVVGYGVTACEGLLFRVGGAEDELLIRGVRTGEVYEPATDTWTPLRNMSQGHFWPAVGCIGGKLYVAGGIGRDRMATKVAEVYDLASGEWSDAAMADLERGVWGGAGLVVEEKLYFVGGSSGGETLATTVVYDPASDSWSEAPGLAGPRFRLGGATVEDGALVLSGWEPVWTPHGAAERLRQCGPSLHVGRISIKSREYGGKFLTAAMVLIVDAGGQPVPGATVRVEWTLPDGSHHEQEAETDWRGLTRYRVKSPLAGTYEVCVTDVVRESYCYDPDQNAETCDSLEVP